MKKKVLLSSILTIALCICLIAGSTFALFTHTSQVSIVANSGDVKMEADVTDFQLYSVKPSNSTSGTLQDEFGKWYAWNGPLNTFTNGGTASFDNSVLTLTNITPGDKVEFNVAGANQSNVNILYRYVIKCESGENLMKALVVYVNGATEGYLALESYTSVWTELKPGESLDKLPIVIEFPVTAGNVFENEAVEISITIEAYQGNANLDIINEPEVLLYNGAANATEFAALLNDPYVSIIEITESFTETVTLANVADKTINVNGNDVDFVVSGVLDNVTITGIKDVTDAEPSIYVDAGTSGTLTVKDCEALGTKNDNKTYGAIAGRGNGGLNLIVDNCNFVTESGNKSGIYFTALGSLKVTNCTFTGFSSWAINDNGDFNGDLVIDDCEFVGCTGVMKILRVINGNFTFTNNTLEDCQLKNTFYVDAQIFADKTTISGNKMVESGVETDSDVDAADLLGIKFK